MSASCSRRCPNARSTFDANAKGGTPLNLGEGRGWRVCRSYLAAAPPHRVGADARAALLGTAATPFAKGSGRATRLAAGIPAPPLALRRNALQFPPRGEFSMNAGERDSGQGSGTRDHERRLAPPDGPRSNDQRSTPPSPPSPPAPDEVISAIADYALSGERERGHSRPMAESPPLPLSPSPPLPAFTPEAYSMARWCLLDSLGCALAALGAPECVRLLGPVVPGAVLPGGARVPGTAWELDPVQAAFNIGAMVRWLDYNDTFLAAEWGHPSDNLGAILATADWLSRGKGETREERGESPQRQGDKETRGQGDFAADRGSPVSAASLSPLPSRLSPLRVRDVLTAMIKAYEIQGVLSLENALNRVGLDHVAFVRVASAAVTAVLLGGSREQVFERRLECLDRRRVPAGLPPRAQHGLAEILGRRRRDRPRRAAGALALRGEMGYPAALSAPNWGFCDALFRGRPLRLARPFASYVIEHILLKVAYPAEFHAQTAVEAAIRLHSEVKGRIPEIARVRIETQESAARIIDKRGPLRNPADRDHCLQYMVAVGLLEGTLSAEHYRDPFAADGRIDPLREKIEVVENPQYSRDYLDPDKRSIANAVQVFFADGSATPRVEVEYPPGHPRRRAEGIACLEEKFRANAAARLTGPQVEGLLELFRDQPRLESLGVDELMAMFVSRVA